MRLRFLVFILVLVATVQPMPMPIEAAPPVTTVLPESFSLSVDTNKSTMITHLPLLFPYPGTYRYFTVVLSVAGSGDILLNMRLELTVGQRTVSKTYGSWSLDPAAVLTYEFRDVVVDQNSDLTVNFSLRLSPKPTKIQTFTLEVVRIDIFTVNPPVDDPYIIPRSQSFSPGLNSLFRTEHPIDFQLFLPIKGTVNITLYGSGEFAIPRASISGTDWVPSESDEDYRTNHTLMFTIRNHFNYETPVALFLSILPREAAELVITTEGMTISEDILAVKSNLSPENETIYNGIILGMVSVPLANLYRKRRRQHMTA